MEISLFLWKIFLLEWTKALLIIPRFTLVFVPLESSKWVIRRECFTILGSVVIQIGNFSIPTFFSKDYALIWTPDANCWELGADSVSQRGCYGCWSLPYMLLCWRSLKIQAISSIIIERNINCTRVSSFFTWSLSFSSFADMLMLDLRISITLLSNHCTIILFTLNCKEGEVLAVLFNEGVLYLKLKSTLPIYELTQFFILWQEFVGQLDFWESQCESELYFVMISLPKMKNIDTSFHAQHHCNSVFLLGLLGLKVQQGLNFHQSLLMLVGCCMQI